MAKINKTDAGIDPLETWYATTSSDTDEALTNESFKIAIDVFGVEKLLKDHAASVLSEKGRENARRRREKDSDGKQAAIKFVYECWLEWQKDPSRYGSKDAFASDMISKHDSLKSIRCITNRCREWESLAKK